MDMLRKALLGIVLTSGLVFTGCSESERVDLGAKGATSPAESGEHGANADQAPPYGSVQVADEEHEIKPIEGPLSNGETDPTMEMSGNIAGQGNYASAAKQREEKPGLNAKQ